MRSLRSLTLLSAFALAQAAQAQSVSDTPDFGLSMDGSQLFGKASYGSLRPLSADQHLDINQHNNGDQEAELSHSDTRLIQPSLESTAIANSVDINVHDDAILDVKQRQEGDTHAELSTGPTDANGIEVRLSASAFGNSFNNENEGAFFVDIDQHNKGDRVEAIIDGQIAGAASYEANATAIGNSISIFGEDGGVGIRAEQSNDADAIAYNRTTGGGPGPTVTSAAFGNSISVVRER